MGPFDILFYLRANPRICKTAKENSVRKEGMALYYLSNVKTQSLQLIFKSMHLSINTLSTAK